jgi:antitoxin PrlF
MIIEEVCTVTAKGQTTVPKAIRQALGVGYGGRIAFRIEDGAVTVRAAEIQDADPALGPFLDLLARDIAARPETLVPLTGELFDRIDAITEGLVVDPDQPIEGDVDL